MEEQQRKVSADDALAADSARALDNLDSAAPELDFWDCFGDEVIAADVAAAAAETAEEAAADGIADHDPQQDDHHHEEPHIATL